MANDTRKASSGPRVRREHRPRPASDAVDDAYEVQPAPAWVGALAAVVQAFFASYLLLAVPAVAAFVGAAAQVTTDATWQGAVRIASGVWLLAHGVPATIAGVEITLVPLGLTALCIVLLRAFARRSARSSLLAWAVVVAGYTLVTVLLAALTHASVPHALAGGLAVSVLGATWGMLPARDRVAAGRPPTEEPLRDWVARRRAALPGWLRADGPLHLRAARTGARAGAITTVLLVGVGTLLASIWVLAGRSTGQGVIAALGIDVTGAIALGIAQAGYFVDLALWAVAWLTGAGFEFGVGSQFAPGVAQSGPLPALPLLSALPSGQIANIDVRWGLGAVAIAAMVGAAWCWRRLWVRAESREVAWQDLLAATVGLTLGAGGLMAILMGVARGAAGPGQLTAAGANPWAVAGIVLAAVMAAWALILLVSHPVPWRAVQRGWTKLSTSARTYYADRRDRS